MGLLPSHWYYNTESGQLTSGNNLENVFNNIFGGLGWHELNISGSATGAQAAVEARKEFPNGATPDYSPVTAGKVASGAAKDAKNAVTGNSGGTGTDCMITLPVVGCILKYTQARALIAGFIIGASGIVGIVGLALLTVEALQRSGAATAAGHALETTGAGLAFIPGAEGAGLALGAVGSAAKRGGSRAGAGASLDQRRRGREYRAQEAREAAEREQAE